jgi:peptide/nickel transport system permease protein
MSVASDSLSVSRAQSLRLAIRSMGLIGLALVAVLVSLSDVIARAPADHAGFGGEMLPPSLAYPFGTDLLGRDILSETLHGLAVTVNDAVLAMIVTLIAGGLAGFVLARLPFRTGYLARWIAGILASVPALLLAMLAVGIFGRDFAPIAAGLAAAPLAFARAFDRARLLNDSPHAEFARASGIPGSTLLRRDLAYELRDQFIAVAARALAAVTITLSTLSFLGFSAHRDLGLVIAAERSSYLEAWWTAAFPALALLLLILFARLAATLEEGERP